ncbi:MAG: thiamine-phosphate kinase [Candidatus Aminicenantes bacterium]|nr:thiamine-phosphate kinase [Candidatus Aminicenantes bacterium]
MKLQNLGENKLISRIRKDFSKPHPDILAEIGDDAAVIKHGQKFLLITKDLLFEGVHFLSPLHPPFLLGRKSLMVNLSDVAAMGGLPKFALLGLGLPPEMDSSWLQQYFAGFKSAASEEGVALIGRDISQTKKIAISVTVIGEGKNIIQRDGAEAGHHIFVSGCLGNARQGLILLKKGYRLGDNKKADPFLKAFLNPSPPITLGKELSRLKLVSSMIDISDGLSVDLSHLCEESEVGAEIHLDRLPLSQEIHHFQRQPYRLALHGGEDYELLFSVPPQNLRSLSRLQKKHQITFIGRMIEKRQIFLIDRGGRRSPLSIKGYQHFQK